MLHTKAEDRLVIVKKFLEVCSTSQFCQVTWTIKSHLGHLIQLMLHIEDLNYTCDTRKGCLDISNMSDLG